MRECSYLIASTPRTVNLRLGCCRSAGHSMVWQSRSFRAICDSSKRAGTSSHYDEVPARRDAGMGRSVGFRLVPAERWPYRKLSEAARHIANIEAADVKPIGLHKLFAGIYREFKP